MNNRIGSLGIHLGRRGPRQPQEVARGLDHHALQAQAQAKSRDLMLARPPQRTQLAFNASDAETTGDDDRVHAFQCLLRSLGSLAGVRGNPTQVYARIIRKATVLHGLGNRKVSVVQVDVFSNQRNLDAVLRGLNALKELVPLAPIHIAESQAQSLDQECIQALAVQCRGDLIDRGRILTFDDSITVNIAHECNLALDSLGKRAVRTQHQGIGLDTDRTQGRNRVLGRFGLEFTSRRQERNQRNVNECDIVATQVGAHLTCGLQEGLGLDIAHGSANLRDDDIGGVSLGVGDGLRAHDALDLIRDVGNDLDGVAQVFAAAFLCNNSGVHLTGRRIRRAGQVHVQEALVVADIQVGFRAVFRDENLTVLEGIHGSRIDIDVGIELLHGNAQTA